jgi:hypothetical protein
MIRADEMRESVSCNDELDMPSGFAVSASNGKAATEMTSTRRSRSRTKKNNESCHNECFVARSVRRPHEE